MDALFGTYVFRVLNHKVCKRLISKPTLPQIVPLPFNHFNFGIPASCVYTFG